MSDKPDHPVQPDQPGKPQRDLRVLPLCILVIILAVAAVVVRIDSTNKALKDGLPGLSTLEPPAPAHAVKVARPGQLIMVMSKDNAKMPIFVHVGDVLAVGPFSYPLNPKFTNAELIVDLKGDQTLDVIGQVALLPSPDSDGRSRRAVYLNVADAGKTVMTVKLVSDGVDVAGPVTYYVHSSGDEVPPPAGDGKAPAHGR